MAIKFQCPHCHKSLTLRDQFAGKRGACPACKKVVTIPTRSTNGPVAPPSPELEEMAAAALADEPAEQVVSATIDFPCPYCDEALHMAAELGGKQAPCPECGRIIKVPMPAKREGKDWRSVQALPTGARRDNEAAPEGAWGSTNVSGVSREALEEAKAIPEKKQQVTTQQWVKRGIFAGAALLVVVVGAIWGMKSLSSRKQASLVRDALDLVSDGKSPPKLGPEKDAAVHRAAAEYYLRSNEKDPPGEARKQLQLARSLLLQAPPGIDRDCGLIDVALTQVDLGGDAPDVDRGSRLKWTDAIKEIHATLKELSVPIPGELESHLTGGRVEGVRAVTRKLLERGQAGLAQALVIDLVADNVAPSMRTEIPEATAVAGLELFREGKVTEATNVAEAAHKLYEAPPPPAAPPPSADGAGVPTPPPPPPVKPAVAPSLVELARALGDTARAEKLHAQLRVMNEPLMAALCKSPPDAGSAGNSLALVQAELRKGNKVPAWVVLRAAKLAVQFELADRLKEFATEVRDPALQGRIQLEALVARVKNSTDKPDLGWTNDAGLTNTKSIAYGLAVETICRASARKGTSLASDVATMEPEAHALGNLGVALGQLDTK